MNRHIITGIIAVMIIGFVVFSYLSILKDKGYRSVSPEEFYRLMQSENAYLIDVHVPEQKHLNGTDAWIPYNRIISMQDLLPEDKNTLILVYCRSGHMSKIAASELVEMGYRNVYELDGGIIAWKKSGLPV